MKLTKEDKMIIRRMNQKDEDIDEVRKKYKNTGSSSQKKKFEAYASIGRKKSEDTANIRAQGKNAPKGKTFGAKHLSGTVSESGKKVTPNRKNLRTIHKDWRKTGMFSVSRPSQRSKK